MKKFFKFLLFIIILHSCSLDNKTGIWNDSKYIQKVKKIESKDIKNLNKNKKFKIKCAFIKKKIDYEVCLGGELAKKNNPKLKNVFVFDRPINFEKKVDLNSKKFLIEKPLKISIGFKKITQILIIFQTFIILTLKKEYLEAELYLKVFQIVI